MCALEVTIFRLSTILIWILELFQPSVGLFLVVLLIFLLYHMRSTLIRDVIIIISSYFSSQVWYLISLTVILIHVFLFTAAAKSDDNYTAVYIGVGTFVAAALVAVIIILVTLR
jgi:hypothetical protein